MRVAGECLDGLDVRIARELFSGQALSPVSWNVRTSLCVLARRLGVDEGTVRNRVRAYHESGFIGGWRTVLNPTLFGGGEIAVWMDVGDGASKDEVLEEARLLPGAMLINCLHGKGACVILRYHDETEVKREVDLLLRIARAEWRVVGRVPFPPCALRLNASDWAILRCMQNDPRKPAAIVAREVDLSTRTVRRRVQRLMDGQAAFALPGLKPSTLRGMLMCGLFVTYPGDRKVAGDARVGAGLDDALGHVFHMLPYAPGGLFPCLYNLFLPNLARFREILRWARDLPGVAECRPVLVEDIETRFEVFDADLEDRVERRSTERSLHRSP